MLHGLAASHGEARYCFYYRPHRFLRSLGERAPSRRLLLDRLPPRCDLFHGLNQRLPEAPMRRSVCTFHDLFVITGDYSTPEFRSRFQAQAKAAAERADVIIAVSAFTARQIRDCLGVEAGRIRVIPHGARRPPASLPAVSRENVILHVGAIQKRKNIARLVRAFERTPAGWKLILAGSFGFGAAEIMDAIEASPRHADIEVPGYVDDGTLEAFYARASIFAFPSLDEGFGMPVLDAMARGVPVLTSDRSALPEVAGDAALLVDPEDSDAIASSLIRLIRDEDLRRDLTHRGAARAKQFSWGNAVEETWMVYRELLTFAA